jgi:hypothetical protein
MFSVYDSEGISQWSVVEWVNKNLLPRVHPQIRRHVKPFAPAVVSIYESTEVYNYTRVFLDSQTHNPVQINHS